MNQIAPAASATAPGVDAEDIRAYYDAHLVNKIADFVDGNPRLEAAWRTIQEWAPTAPRRILDIGCGFGQVSWQLAQRWPTAHVMGVDISPRSIALAAQVFQLPNLSFRVSETAFDEQEYDLITLIDVFEHIAAADRSAFVASLSRVLSRDGVLVVTCPTPAYQRFLREHEPDKLQPVDEDISLSVVQSLADATGARIAFFREQSIWMTGDYQHTVLTRSLPLDPVRRAAHRPQTVADRVARKVRAWHNGPAPGSREYRLGLIERALGPGVYRPR